MKNRFAVPAVALLTIALAVPAFAGGDHCKDKNSATAAGAGKASCSSASRSAAWAGAWFERSESGMVTVAEVAAGSPAARSGLRSGDVVVAVNGRDLTAGKEGASCSATGNCSVGSSFAYTVHRGRSTKVLKLKLEKMPAEATSRFADRDASYDHTLAAVVVASIN